ncbi:MAG: hypothetical protein IT374_17025 [Polyangiaceae bacterium]|nr:hypothetical protein [Polyangiaceae bacterium]
MSALPLAACGGLSSADQLFEGRASAGASGAAGKAGAGAGASGASGSSGATQAGGAGLAGASAAGAPSASGGAGGSAGGGGGQGFGGKPGKGGAPGVDCSELGSKCQQCCDDQTDGVVTQAFVIACGCAKGAQCEKACGSNLCTGKQPSMQCAGCLNGVDDDAPCVEGFQKACQEDPKCAAAIPCFEGCQ